MKPFRRYISMTMAAVSLLLLGFVVAVAARSRPGTADDDSLFEMNSPLEVDITRVLAWVIIAMAVMGAVLFAMGVKQAKPQEGRRKRSLLGLILGVVAFFLILRFLQPLSQSLFSNPPAPETPEAVAQASEQSGRSSSWIFSLLVAAVIAAALTRVGQLTREGDVSFDTSEAEVPAGAGPVQVLAPARTPLTLGVDPKSRVLAAYEQFEMAATSHGPARKSTETANRYARRAGKELGLDPTELRQLMNRYSRSRFGFRAIGREEAEGAEAASDRLCQEIST